MLATEAAISEMNAMAMVAEVRTVHGKRSNENKMSHAVESAAGYRWRIEMRKNS